MVVIVSNEYPKNHSRCAVRYRRRSFVHRAAFSQNGYSRLQNEYLNSMHPLANELSKVPSVCPISEHAWP